MDIFFQDPDDIPLPPDEVRIKTIEAIFAPDKSKVRLIIQLDPFLLRPSLEITATDPENEVFLASSTIIETMSKNCELTLHLGQVDDANDVEITVKLYYLEDPIIGINKESDDVIPNFNPRVMDNKTIRLTI